MTATTGYRFTMPDPDISSRYELISFGIEPIGVNSKGKTVKTGKAVVRIGIRGAWNPSWDTARKVALMISDHLNAGGDYAGPKTIVIDATYPCQAHIIKSFLVPFEQ